MSKTALTISTLASAAVLISGLTGCTTKAPVDYANTRINSELNSTVITNSTDSNLAKKINETKLADTFVDINYQKTLKEVLEILGKIEGRIYFLDENSENIMVPISDFKIKSVNDLKRYLETTTNKTIKITKNKYLKNMPKLVAVEDLYYTNLLKTTKKSYQSRGKQISADALLSDFIKETGFSVVYKTEHFKSQNSREAGASIFAETLIDFNGDNAYDFLKYIERTYNLFTDIDYKNKLITISKYKSKHFKLAIGNVELETSTSSGSETLNMDKTEIKNTIKPGNILIRYWKWMNTIKIP